MIQTYLKRLEVNIKHSSSALIIYVGTFCLLASLLTYGAEVRAQEIGGSGGRWEITPSVSLYEYYTDNVDLTPEGDVSAFITEFSPGIMFRLPSSRGQLRINTNLKLDYRMRSDGEEETLSWYNLWAYWGRQSSPRTSYEISMGYDIYYTDEDLSSPFINVFDALTRSDVFFIQPGLSYNISKTFIAKVGGRYGVSTYESSEGVDGENLEWSLYLSKKLGSRISVETGVVYRDITYENETGFTEMEVPLSLDLDLTYVKLKLGGAYVSRDYEDEAGPVTPSGEVDEFGSQNFMFYGIGFELGGQVLKLRSTTLELNYDTKIQDDLCGFPYLNTELRLSLYHAFRKFDFYADLKYGMNDYVESDDKITYYGAAAGLKWYINDKSYAGVNLDYTFYGYEFGEIATLGMPISEITADYDVITASIDYNYNLYDWLFVGLAYGFRQSGSDVEEGNYSENTLSLFARATW